MPSFETYLITPTATDDCAFRMALETAVSALKPASVLLVMPDGDERAQINLIKALAPAVQAQGAALLVTCGPQAAVRGGADGAHAPSVADVIALREALPADRIVGAGGLVSRHDAMDAGEAGADYVMFGEVFGGRAPMADSALIERAAWWAEIFETPCVAVASHAGLVVPLSFTRAEFIALGPWAFTDPRAAADLLSQAREGRALADAPTGAAGA
jgi:thiamine-phosphate pyrophosphorylase